MSNKTAASEAALAAAEQYYGVKPTDPPECGLRDSVRELAALLDSFARVEVLRLLAEIRKLPRYGPEYEYDTGLQMVQHEGAECVFLSDIEELPDLQAQLKEAEEGR